MPMKNRIFLFSIILLSVFPIFGQGNEKYEKIIFEADDFYNAKEFLKSKQKYAEALAILDKDAAIYEYAINDRYKAAVAAVAAKDFDFAFNQIFKITEDKKFYTLAGYIRTDKNFEPLHQDKRWRELLEIIRKADEKQSLNYDKSLIATLDAMYDEDQKYRLQQIELEKKGGSNSEEWKALWKTIEQKDAENQEKIEKLLSERGWLGVDKIGLKGTTTIFLVIQHADLKMQEKYLPMMREAVKKGDLRAGSLALLEDRILLAQGKKQIYGSQLFTDLTGKTILRPLEDPDNVDKRRRAVGLNRLKYYLTNFGLIWNLEEYKKSLQ